jgi:hypothetical protein
MVATGYRSERSDRRADQDHIADAVEAHDEDPSRRRECLRAARATPVNEDACCSTLTVSRSPVSTTRCRLRSSGAHLAGSVE